MPYFLNKKVKSKHNFDFTFKKLNINSKYFIKKTTK